jgi:toxin ParE1/3/4
MSANFRITPRAQDDLKSIGRYTLRKWGKKQRDLYLHDLDKRFQWLADQPQIGKERPDIKDGYYCFSQGSHLIFYIIHQDNIDIIGIPHKSMDIVNYFNPD